MPTLPPYLTITNDPTETLKKLVEKWSPDRLGILVDENTKHQCLNKMEIDHDLVMEIKSGEEHKTLETCRLIWRKLTDAGFSRKSLLLNLGGGVIGDMGGFAASTFKRGIKFVNIPTTLLSQVDASIGGKLGIDFDGFKNHIGVFKDPDHVVVDASFLETLSTRQLKSGFAEVIKHALIADKLQWNWLTAHVFDTIHWKTLIPKSLAIKNKVVEHDPTEKGYRKILNFGHTLGHALESHFMATTDKLLHGEAVVLGMILESHLSYQKGWISPGELNQIKSYILKIYDLPLALPSFQEIKWLLSQDKKNDASGVNFALINDIGKCVYDEKATDKMIEKAMSFYRSDE